MPDFQFPARTRDPNKRRRRIPQESVTLAQILDMVDRWYPTTEEARRLSLHVLSRAHKWPNERAEHCAPDADHQPPDEADDAV